MHCIKPVNSEEYWTPCDAPRTEPPNIKRPAHRPKMKRNVDPVEPEMHATKVKKTIEVTCSKCGQLGHYYKTCKNDPKDPNWQPLTKKERRAGKGKGLQIVPFYTNQNRGQDVGPNVNLNSASVQPPPPMDPQVAGEAMNLNQPPPQPCSTPNLSYAQRRKHPVVRPPTAPISPPPSFGQPTPPSVQAASGLIPCVPTGQAVNPRTTTANVPFQQSAPSAETMAAASSGTAARLFKFIPTPGFIPPRKT
ncbi:branchpoint-bridging protein-like [Arachis duranensis]|uniref:Branchpoint-bridging protein-like n=1 Tax=Arachis duranensis TaxID=130453 RepID=A0A6P4D0G7_ARADU|nr:branchpoint-bridging protein-like [Arachis duranensis]